MTTVQFTEKEVEFLGKLLKAVTLPGVEIARTAVSVADKLGFKDDPDGN